MKKNLLLLFYIVIFGNQVYSQFYQQYFDGADTSSWNSIFIVIDTSSSNIWQVGEPHKTIFNSASTFPNALMTDTINNYPENISSSVHIALPVESIYWHGIVAVQWAQKLDMDENNAVGMVEFSVDNGDNWQNAFDNPYTYNFFGYNYENEVTLPSGEKGFSGKDTLWKNIWLCYDTGWLSSTDTLQIKFTFISYESDETHEGWMIDNLLIHPTYFHTINENKPKSIFNVFPNPSCDRVYIEIMKFNEFHIIENMRLINMKGQVMEEWENIPASRFFIDVDTYEKGTYLLHIKTNKFEESIPIIIE